MIMAHKKSISDLADKADSDTKPLLNTVIAEFEDLESKLSPSLIRMQQLQDVEWWGNV